MSKQFLKKEELQLLNGGYLSNKEGNPVSNKAFVEAQNHAEYIVTFAEMAKDKDFKGKKADILEDLKKEVVEFINKSKPTVFVAKPTAVEKPLSSKLAEEALNFINFQENSSRVDKINNFLQQFTILNEFEQFGLFFEEDIVKLEKIYTMKEVVDSVTSVIDLLN